jgi:hypothetical protein
MRRKEDETEGSRSKEKNVGAKKRVRSTEYGRTASCEAEEGRGERG